MQYILCPKNDTSLSCYNFDVHEPILIIIGKNVNEKVSNQNVFIVPPHLTSACALPGETQKHRNRIFSLKCWITALLDFNQSLVYFIQSCYLQLMLTLLV